MPKLTKIKQVDNQSNADLHETLSSLRDRLKDNQKNFTYFAIGILLLITIVITAIAYYRYISSTADESLAEGQAIYYGMNPKANPAERLQKSLELFKKSYDFKASPAAMLYIANVQAEMGNIDEAIKTLNDMKAKYAGSNNASMASLRLAYLYIKKGDTESALKAFNDVSSLANGAFMDIALFESSNLLKAQGKTAEAEAKLKELSEKFPTSSLSGKPTTSVAKADNQSK